MEVLPAVCWEEMPCKLFSFFFLMTLVGMYSSDKFKTEDGWTQVQILFSFTFYTPAMHKTFEPTILMLVQRRNCQLCQVVYSTVM